MNIVAREYHSIRAMGAAAEAAKPLCYAESEHHGIGDHDWTLGVDFPEAQRMALSGGRWDEGAAKLQAAHVETTKALSEAVAPSQDYGVTGHTLDVGEYLTGNPEHWLCDGDDEPTPAPVISVGVSTSRSWYITAEQVVNRGAAILSCIDDLESQGARIEIWAVHAVEGDGTATNFRTLVKAADQQWSPSAAAYALCHPAFSRRNMFRIMESIEEVGDLGGSYGRGFSGAAVREGLTIWIPAMLKRREFNTPAESIKQVLEYFGGAE